MRVGFVASIASVGSLLRTLALIVLMIGLGPGVAFAEPSRAALNACFDHFEQTQVARREGRYIEAADHASKCRATFCPQEIISACSAWNIELARDLPSAVFSVRTESGADAEGYQVEIDGRMEEAALSGYPVALDPGEHQIRFVGPSDFSQDVRLVMSVGEKNRSVSLRLSDPGPDGTGDPSRVTPWVVVPAALGVAGLGVALFGAIRAADIKSGLDACAGSCTPGQGQGAHDYLTVADLGLLVGSLSLAT